jgi:asparagine synthetase B (glutamine-hydrolysing)
MHGKLKTFAVGQEGSPDIVAARAVSRFLDTDHFEALFTPEDAFPILEKITTTWRHIHSTATLHPVQISESLRYASLSLHMRLPKIHLQDSYRSHPAQFI